MAIEVLRISVEVSTFKKTGRSSVRFLISEEIANAVLEHDSPEFYKIRRVNFLVDRHKMIMRISKKYH